MTTDDLAGFSSRIRYESSRWIAAAEALKDLRAELEGDDRGYE